MEGIESGPGHGGAMKTCDPVLIAGLEHSNTKQNKWLWGGESVHAACKYDMHVGFMS